MGWMEKVKAGGGRLDGMEGAITNYNFEDSTEYDQIQLTFEVTADGADDPTFGGYLYLGSNKFLVIEEDGKVLVSSDENGTPNLYEKGEAYQFLSSLEEAGFPAEARFEDPGETGRIDLRPHAGDTGAVEGGCEDRRQDWQASYA